MAKIYITVSFDGTNNREEIEYLCSLIKKAGFEDFCFIRDIKHFKHVFDSPEELMIQTLGEVKKCDYLLIDMSDKPIGRAIEAGMAYALGKKIVVIMKKGTAIKDTTRGIADVIIKYDNLEKIVQKLESYPYASNFDLPLDKWERGRC